jgi:hypothetical protein
VAHQHTDLSWVDGNLEDAVQLLAETAVRNREKRSVDFDWNSVKDWGTNNVVNPVSDYVAKPIVDSVSRGIGIDANTLPNIQKHLTWGMLGAGAGGLLGLGTSMTGKKKRPLSGLLTGGLLGGTLGAGGSMLHSNMGAITDSAQHEAPPPKNPRDTGPMIPGGRFTVGGHEVQLPDYLHEGDAAWRTTKNLGMDTGAVAVPDAIGLFRRWKYNRPNLNSKELLQLVEHPTAGNSMPAEVMNYLRQVNAQHGEAGLDRLIAGEQVPVDVAATRGNLDSAIEAFRQQAAEEAQAKLPTHDLPALGRNVRSSLTELAQQADRPAAQRVLDELASNNISEAEAARRLQNIVRQSPQGLDAQAGGMTGRQWAAMQDEVSRLEASGMPPEQIQARLAHLAKKGLKHNEVPGDYAFNPAFDQRMNQTLRTAGIDPADWDALSEPDKRAVWEQIKNLPENSKDFKFRIPRAATRPIQDAERIAGLRDMLGKPNAWSRSDWMPRDGLNMQDIQTIVAELKKPPSVSGKIVLPGQNRAIPRVDAQAMLAEIERGLGGQEVGLNGGLARATLGERYGAQPAYEVPGEAFETYGAQRTPVAPVSNGKPLSGRLPGGAANPDPVALRNIASQPEVMQFRSAVRAGKLDSILGQEAATALRDLDEASFARVINELESGGTGPIRIPGSTVVVDRAALGQSVNRMMTNDARQAGWIRSTLTGRYGGGGLPYTKYVPRALPYGLAAGGTLGAEYYLHRNTSPAQLERALQGKK